jgi:long-subunit acyl-CoA synthetase (AMP-forming)
MEKPVRIICGGAAVPESLLRGLDGFGFHITHLWGMTETTPMATTGTIKSTLVHRTDDEKYKIRTKQGIAAPLVELRVMRAQGEAPWDGTTSGELEVRGPPRAISSRQKRLIAGALTDGSAPAMSRRWMKKATFIFLTAART